MKSRFLRKMHFGNIATFACAGMTLVYLISAIVYVLVSQLNGIEISSITNTIINYVINIVFFLLLTFTFSRVKDSFENAYQGILTLVLATFILPLIFGFISNLGDVFGFISQLLSSIVGIIYFIILILDHKNRGAKHKPYEITLIVLGCIIAAFGLLVFISSISFNISYIKGAFQNGNVFYIVSGIISIVVGFFEFLIDILYLGYALGLRKARKYNY